MRFSCDYTFYGFTVIPAQAGGASKNSEWVSVLIPNRVDYTKAVILAQGVPPEGVCPLTRESSAPTKVINNKREDINTLS